MEISPSYFRIIAFVGLIGFILASLKIVNFFAKRILKGQRFRSFWNRYFGVFELVTWLFFGLLSIEYFSVRNTMIAIILSGLLSIVLFIGIYYYLKEILIRIFFKLTTDIKVGDEVKSEKLAGKIIKTESNHLVIEQADGSQTGIPYSKIITRPLIKQSPSNYLHRFECSLYVPTFADRNNIRQQLNFLLSTDLRVSATVEPKITFSEHDEQNYQVKVITFLFDPEDSEPLRESLKTAISD